MSGYPIRHLTLYKHGVGFFVRQFRLEGDTVRLSFKEPEMNDILKSLTVQDFSHGQVLGIDYDTPKSKDEKLESCSVNLQDSRSLRDLVTQLRGRQVRLLLDKDETCTGTLLGLDEAPDPKEALEKSLVSLLVPSPGVEPDARVQTFRLDHLHGLELLDRESAADLRFFLETAAGQETFRQVRIRLSPGEHDLAVSYIAPAPTWRVSYRMVVSDEAAAPSSTPGTENETTARLLGWGIFDNQLEEDLEDISLALVAGMPFSFIYDLYQPYTPERPVVGEEDRTAGAPPEFEAKMAPQRSYMMAAPAPAAMEPGYSLGDALDEMLPVAHGENLGELFQYRVSTPVSVRRGQSAMAPILSSALRCRKELLYNGAKFAKHPVATLRLENQTGLALERGPVTVLSDRDYLGEAVLPFTPLGGEIVVPYAVELGVKVREESGQRQELNRVAVAGAYLRIEEWTVYWRRYQLNNGGQAAARVLVEHPRHPSRTLHETPEPVEQTAAVLRFAVEVPAHGEETLNVQERQLHYRQEEIRRISHSQLADFLKKGLLKQPDYETLMELLKLWQQIADLEKTLKDLENERKQIYEAQNQLRNNFKALNSTGKEGEMRAQYIEKLEASERELEALAERTAAVRAEIDAANQAIAARLKS